MRSLKLIQVGDIHFPEALQKAALVDYKDPGMLNGLVASATANALEQVTREIRVLRSQTPKAAGLLLCGDLTTKGDLDAYRRCLEYLEKSLEIGNQRVWLDSEIHAVPGNHDVDRSKTDQAGTNLDGKFDSIVGLWQQYRKDILPISKPRMSVIANGVPKAAVFSLNSCLGCGEWRSRLMPPGMPDELREQFKHFIQDPGQAPESFQRLDTPAFREADIDAVISDINSLPDETAAVILAHHNILPQELPRIDLYTEVINGGMARARLARCRRPIIYLHGHIHLDPIELVLQPDATGIPTGRLISIAAPEYITGFNVIEIHYGRLRFPIGVSVHRYRVNPGGGVTALLPPVRLPLYDHRDATEQNFADDVVQKVVASLPLSATQWVRFRDVVKVVTGHTEETLAEAILEAEWLGFVRVVNRHKAPKMWQIGRLAP